jgi:hypothetical protein
VGASIAGIAVCSLGLSVLIPIVFGAVGHGSAAEHGSASVTGAVAKFTTLSYTGSLLGPAAIGRLAQGIGLTWSLSCILLVLAAIGWFATWTSHALPAHQEDQPAMTARARSTASPGIPVRACFGAGPGVPAGGRDGWHRGRIAAGILAMITAGEQIDDAPIGALTNRMTITQTRLGTLRTDLTRARSIRQ